MASKLPGTIQPLAISMPFTIDKFGGIATTTDQRKIWGDRVRSAVGTALTQRVMRPAYGTAIPQMLFDSVDVVTETLEAEINTVFASYLSELVFEETSVRYDDKQNIISLDVRYRLPDGNEELVTLGVASLNGNQIIREEL